MLNVARSYAHQLHAPLWTRTGDRRADALAWVARIGAVAALVHVAALAGGSGDFGTLVDRLLLMYFALTAVFERRDSMRLAAQWNRVAGFVRFDDPANPALSTMRVTLPGYDDMLMQDVDVEHVFRGPEVH